MVTFKVLIFKVFKKYYSNKRLENILVAIYTILFLTQNTSIPNQLTIFVLYSKKSSQMIKKKNGRGRATH